MQRALTPIAMPPGTPLGEATILYARQYLDLGVREIVPNRGPYVRLFMRGGEGTKQPWCAGAVRQWVTQACASIGLARPPFRMSVGCRELARYAQEAGRFLPGGQSGGKAVRGSIFVVPKPGGGGWFHTGIVTGVEGEEVTTVEGNGLPLDVPVLTPKGWRPIGDLNVGDVICGPDGDAGVVTGVFPQGMRPVFKLEMTDGSVVTADDQHRWSVKVGPGKQGIDRVLTTAELAELLALGRRVSLPRIRPVLFMGAAPAELPLHPYLLGLLLGDGGLSRCGDGSNGHVRFTQRDKSVLSDLRSLLPTGCELTHVANDDYRIVGVQARDALRDIGLAGLTSVAKFVPEQYLWADTESRLELLRGLMDTDGSIDVAGRMEFCSVSPHLAKAVQFLVRSLGGKVTIYLRTGVTYTSKTQTEPKSAQDAYVLRNIRFPPQNGIVPFRMERKAARVVDRTGGWMRGWSIRSVVPAGEKETVCISVSTQSSLYITDHFIPTHNTNLAGSAEGTHVLARRRPRAALDYLLLDRA